MSEYILQPTEEISRLAADALKGLLQAIGSGQQDTYTVRVDGTPDHPLVLPGPAVRMLSALLAELGKGSAVSVTAHASELTMQEAAEILNVKGPVLVNLIEHGTLPHRRAGSRPLLRFSDVIEYKRRREAETRELAALSEEMKLDGPL